MKALAKFLLVVMLGILFMLLTCTKENLWKKLSAKFGTLYQQGQYSEAASVAKEALTVAEKTFGPDHPDVATSLNNLAELYRAQGEYAQAGDAGGRR